MIGINLAIVTTVFTNTACLTPFNINIFIIHIIIEPQITDGRLFPFGLNILKKYDSAPNNNET